MKDIKSEQDKYVYICIGICLCMALISFGLYIVNGSGAFTLMTDFNSQQIPFSIAVNDALKSGEFGWMWNVDLGTNIIGAFSFYNLGSPFFWCSLLFPAESFPYVVGWLFILKYVVAGGTSYLYIKRFVSKSQSAVFGAVIYAFSGFQCVNLMFYHFHDVVAFFPLLLLGVEELVEDGKKGKFAIAVFINCLVNYYFFCGEVIFAVIYYLFRFGIKKDSFKKIISCCVEGIMGIGMASAIFLPSIIFIVDNPKASSGILTSGKLFFDLERYLEILGGILLPAEPMYQQAIIATEDFTSTAAYLPGLGIVLIIAYIVKKRNWLSNILLTSLIISLLPIANSMFTGFSQDYRRWWYMPVLIMALISALVLDKWEEYNIKNAVVISSILTLVFSCILILSIKQGKVELYSKQIFLGMLVLVLMCNLLIYFFQIKTKYFDFGMICLVIIVAILTTSWSIYQYRIPSDSTETLVEKWNTDRTLNSYDINYRHDTDNSGAYVAGLHSLRTYNSTITGTIFEMHKSLGLSRTPAVVLFDVPGVVELLGGKYYITSDVDENSSIIEEVMYGAEKKYVVEQEACPIGFTYDNYILQSEFLELEKNLRGYAALKGLVVDDKIQNEVGKYLNKLEVSDFTEKDLETITEIVGDNAENIVSINEMNSKGFKASCVQESPKYAFFSVPYEKGWTAYINGKEADIIKVHGMMSILLQEGENQIQFKYEIPGFKLGSIITIGCWIIWIVYINLFKGQKIKGKLCKG